MASSDKKKKASKKRGVVSAAPPLFSGAPEPHKAKLKAAKKAKAKTKAKPETKTKKKIKEEKVVVTAPLFSKPVPNKTGRRRLELLGLRWGGLIDVGDLWDTKMLTEFTKLSIDKLIDHAKTKDTGEHDEQGNSKDVLLNAAYQNMEYTLDAIKAEVPKPKDKNIKSFMNRLFAVKLETLFLGLDKDPNVLGLYMGKSMEARGLRNYIALLGRLSHMMNCRIVLLYPKGVPLPRPQHLYWLNRMLKFDISQTYQSNLVVFADSLPDEDSIFDHGTTSFIVDSSTPLLYEQSGFRTVCRLSELKRAKKKSKKKSKKRVKLEDTSYFKTFKRSCSGSQSVRGLVLSSTSYEAKTLELLTRRVGDILIM